MANFTAATRTGLALALLLFTAACGGHDRSDAADAPAAALSVTAATAAQTSLPRILSASGAVTAWEEVPVGAETGGLTAVAVLVDEGAWVRQGQPLVRLNDELLQAQLRQQQASVEAARANAEREAGDLARARQLHGQGYLSQASLDLAVSEERSARAQLDAAEAGLAEIRTRLSQTVIRAPVSGQIIRRSVTRGQIVQPGAELFRMVRDGRLELDAQVPEAELPLVRAGMTATIASAEAGQVTGTVRIVTPEVDPQTRLGVARIALASGSGLRPGMFARATIDVGAQPALTIPSAAVVYREGKAGVYVIGDDAVVRFRPVRTGARSGDDLAVLEGLSAGQRVAVRGAGFLADGDRVSVVADAAPAGAQAGTQASTQAAR